MPHAATTTTVLNGMSALRERSGVPGRGSVGPRLAPGCSASGRSIETLAATPPAAAALASSASAALAAFASSAAIGPWSVAGGHEADERVGLPEGGAGTSERTQLLVGGRQVAELQPDPRGDGRQRGQADAHRVRDEGQLGARDADRRDERPEGVAHDEDGRVVVEEDERSQRRSRDQPAPPRGEERLDQVGQPDRAARPLHQPDSAAQPAGGVHQGVGKGGTHGRRGPPGRGAAVRHRLPGSEQWRAARRAHRLVKRMTPACSAETKAPHRYVSKTRSREVSGMSGSGTPACSSSAPLHTPSSIARITCAHAGRGVKAWGGSKGAIGQRGRGLLGKAARVCGGDGGVLERRLLGGEVWQYSRDTGCRW
eukprot:scaffold2489_cov110-Isochrysis_galbana.AAC.7